MEDADTKTITNMLKCSIIFHHHASQTYLSLKQLNYLSTAQNICWGKMNTETLIAAQTKGTNATFDLDHCAKE